MYQQSAQEAFSRLSPQERMQFGQYLQQQARQRNVQVADLNQDGIDDRFQDPAFSRQVTGRMDQQQPGLLGQLLGGGGGGGQGMLANPIAKAALAGIAAMAVKNVMGGR